MPPQKTGKPAIPAKISKVVARFSNDSEIAQSADYDKWGDCHYNDAYYDYDGCDDWDQSE